MLSRQFQFFLLAAFLAAPVAAMSTTCKTLLPPTLERFHSPSGRELVYHHTPGKKKMTWVFLHGLGDDMTDMAGLSQLAQSDGFGTLRVDFHGHGESLRLYLQSQNGRLPSALPYSHNVEDVFHLIHALKLKDVVIVGHSYGGGIAYELGVHLASTSIQLRSVHMLAPYVQRLDKSLSYFPGFVMDLWTDEFMRENFTKYFLQEWGKVRHELRLEEERLLEMKVEAALLATKGIRDLDLLDHSRELRAPEAPVHLLAGDRDELLPSRLLENFRRRLENQQVPHSYQVIEGDDATHFFPQNRGREVYQHMLEFVRSLRK